MISDELKLQERIAYCLTAIVLTALVTIAILCLTRQDSTDLPCLQYLPGWMSPNGLNWTMERVPAVDHQHYFMQAVRRNPDANSTILLSVNRSGATIPTEAIVCPGDETLRILITDM